jgi:sulfonate transport system ATP-binding protein
LLRQLVDRRRPATLLVTHDVDEAILLADRIMVLADGRIRWDQPVDLERPRRRKAVAMAALRARLLTELGVEDA